MEEESWEWNKRQEAEEALFSACEEGNADDVQTILTDGRIKNVNIIFGLAKEIAKRKKLKGKQPNRGLMSAAEVVSARGNGLRPIHVATMYGHSDVINVLRDLGADVAAVDAGGRTALHYACALEDVELVECLLEEETDINVQDCEGHTPLFWAINHWQTDVIGLLLDEGAKVDMKNRSGNTVLSELVHAVFCLQLEEKDTVAVIERLIENGADVNSIDTDGNTALHWSAQFGLPEISKLLLRKGIDKGLRNSSGDLAEDLSDELTKNCFLTAQC